MIIMKISKSLMLGLVSATLFVACSTGTSSKEENAEEVTVAKETCTYSYIADSTTLKWTAYKFTKRAGVSGTFDHITVNNTKSAENPMDALVGANFSIQTASVNSGNQERDPKLVAHFFTQLVNTEMITGKIVSVNNGEAVVSIIMNDASVDVVGKVAVTGNKVTLTTSLTMEDFGGLAAVASLNEACSALHTDKDGESKLWPDVDVVITTVLKKECK